MDMLSPTDKAIACRCVCVHYTLKGGQATAQVATQQLRAVPSVYGVCNPAV